MYKDNRKAGLGTRTLDSESADKHDDLVEIKLSGKCIPARVKEQGRIMTSRAPIGCRTDASLAKFTDMRELH
jgi:hypothetical protein